jgi:hypothetical protein
MQFGDAIMSFRGRVQNGSVVLEEPLSLPDGTIVDIQEVPSAAGVIEKNWQALAAVAGHDLVDPDVYRQLRESDRLRNVLAGP